MDFIFAIEFLPWVFVVVAVVVVVVFNIINPYGS